MNLKRQAMWNQAVTACRRACRALKPIMRDESGVTSIEYALLASLIALVAATGIGILGGKVRELWDDVAKLIIAEL